MRFFFLLLIGLCLVFVFQNCGVSGIATKSAQGSLENEGKSWQEIYPFEKIETLEVETVHLSFDHARKNLKVEVLNPAREIVCSRTFENSAYDELRANFAKVYKPKRKPDMMYAQVIIPVGTMKTAETTLELYDVAPFVENKEGFDALIARFKTCADY